LSESKRKVEDDHSYAVYAHRLCDMFLNSWLHPGLGFTHGKYNKIELTPF